MKIHRTKGEDTPSKKYSFHEGLRGKKRVKRTIQVGKEKEGKGGKITYLYKDLTSDLPDGQINGGGGSNHEKVPSEAILPNTTKNEKVVVKRGGGNGTILILLLGEYLPPGGLVVQGYSCKSPFYSGTTSSHWGMAQEMIPTSLWGEKSSRGLQRNQ